MVALIAKRLSRPPQAATQKKTPAEAGAVDQAWVAQ